MPTPRRRRWLDGFVLGVFAASAAAALAAAACAALLRQRDGEHRCDAESAGSATREPTAYLRRRSACR